MLPVFFALLRRFLRILLLKQPDLLQAPLFARFFFFTWLLCIREMISIIRFARNIHLVRISIRILIDRQIGVYPFMLDRASSARVVLRYRQTQPGIGGW